MRLLLGAVCSGSTLFVYEASNILVDDKNIHCVINVSSVWIRLGFSLKASTFARPKQLINSSTNYK